MKLAQNLEKSFKSNANCLALEVENTKITYQQLSNISHNLASFFTNAISRSEDFAYARNTTDVRGGGEIVV